MEHLSQPRLPAPLDWWKGCAVTDRTIYELATDPRLIALLRPLLGDNIVLWGASTVVRRRGKSHPWHTDMESAARDCRAATVWLAIRNASEKSGLLFVAGSHRFGLSAQEALANWDEGRATVTDDRILEMARTMEPAARIVRPAVSDGEIILFDGRIWHSSRNDDTLGARTALLLQYASVDTPIPMPVASGYKWPLQYQSSPRVPAILVSGTGHESANRLVPPPPPETRGKPMITTLARSVPLPLAEDPVKRWRPYHQFHGPTRTLAGMSCHISVLSAGHHPHPPHIHADEELLIVLDGEVEIELADNPAGSGSKRHPLKPGLFSYYPAGQHHSIHNAGSKPATYLMFKWQSGIADSGEPLQASIFEYDIGLAATKPMVQKLLFQQATHSLGKLHAHLTTLQPGAGYAPHADAYDVAIIVLSGEVETVGERVAPLGLIYYSAGELHGMKNVGNVPAIYLVFEFHSPAIVALSRQKAEARRLRQERHQARVAEQQRRKLEKQRRKRGVRSLVRRVVKALRKLGQ